MTNWPTVFNVYICTYTQKIGYLIVQLLKIWVNDLFIFILFANQILYKFRYSFSVLANKKIKLISSVNIEGRTTIPKYIRYISEKSITNTKMNLKDGRLLVLWSTGKFQNMSSQLSPCDLQTENGGQKYIFHNVKVIKVKTQQFHE